MAKFKYTAQRGLTLLGDEKGAWMADTTAETLVGSELVTNGDFATDTDWSKGTGWTIASGVASCDGTQTSSTDLGQAIGAVPLSAYIVTYTVLNYSAGTIQSNFLGTGGTGASKFANGTYTETIIAPSDATGTIVIRGSSTFVGDIDNVSVRLADPDLSTANNGLGVYGSIIKSEVATGAGLMAYSGFSTSNYLEQPYNSDLDFGTGDFCFMGWFNLSSLSLNSTLLDRSDSDGSNRIRISYRNGTDNIQFYLQDGASGSAWLLTDSALISINTDYHIACVRSNSGTTLNIYINGVLIKTGSVATRDVSSSDSTANLRMGLYYSNTNPIQGLLSIWRPFNYAPTAAQIKAIYNDEKHLFKKYSTYTQKGEQYTLDVPLQSADRTRKMVGKTVTTLSGKRQTLVHRNEQPWSVKTGFIHRTDATDYPLLSEVDEFIYSTQGSEVFTADVYDSGDDENMVMLSSDVSDAREETSDIFTASFNMQESNQ